MWTRNGSETLAKVLIRLNNVIPHSAVGKRIVVDDNSVDNTRQIANRLGWCVIPNEGTGISDGANTALKHVEADFFASFEQDLLLAKNWWRKVPPLLADPNVAVASGMRFASQPLGLRKLQQHVAKKYLQDKPASWLKSRQMAAFTLGKTLDNTIYRTESVLGLGGFPKMSCSGGVDTILAYRIKKAGLHWVVNYDVQSVHLRFGLRHELEHQRFYATTLREIWVKVEEEIGEKPPVTKLGVYFRLIISPATGVFTAFKTRSPSIIYIHPLIRLYYALGLLEVR